MSLEVAEITSPTTGYHHDDGTSKTKETLVSAPASKRPRRRPRGWDVETIPGAQHSMPGNIEVESSDKHTAEMVAKQQQEAALLVQQQMAVQKAQLAMAQQAQALQSAAASSLSRRIYVGSINYDLKEQDIVTLFSTFGTVTKSEMSMDQLTGRSKGFCFVEFADVASAEAAMAMDGFELAGRKIKVGKPHHGQGGSAVQAPQPAAGVAIGLSGGLSGLGGSAIGTGVFGGALPGMGLGLGSAAAGTNLAPAGLTAVPAAPAAPAGQDTVLVSNIQEGVGEAELRAVFAAFGTVSHCYVAAERRQGAVQFADAAVAAAVAGSMHGFDLAGSLLQCALMNRTAADNQLGLPQKPPPPTTGPSAGGGGGGAEARSVLLLNMVSAEDVQDPELEGEIAEEAAAYGALQKVDIQVGAAEAGGDGEVRVLLHYADAASAAKALQAMNGRVFAGNKIDARLVHT